MSGQVQGMHFDKLNNCFWFYSTHKICKLEITDEDKDAWKIYLDNK